MLVLHVIIGVVMVLGYALDEEGRIWTWGDNKYKTPTRVESDVRFVDISTGYHGCSALDEVGRLWNYVNGKFSLVF